MTNKEQVLVVDDEMGIRNLLKAMLQKKGYGVETAESAEQAFGLLSSERFDLVITDCVFRAFPARSCCSRSKENIRTCRWSSSPLSAPRKTWWR